MATNTKLEEILKQVNREKFHFSMSLDSYTRVNFERNGRTRLYATTIKGAEIPLTLPIDLRDPRLEYDQQANFLESIYSARENSARQIEWALRFGEYTKEKTLIKIIKNIATFGSLKTKENEILNSMAQTYLAWAILAETTESLARNIAKFTEFYGEVAEISNQMQKRLYLDYSHIASMKGFADEIYKGDLEAYKISIICTVKTRKIKS
jgi:hypothetical protein